MAKQYIPKKTLVKRAAEGAGLGLFAQEDIKKGEFIIEYWGEVITQQEANKRGGRYLFETSKNRVVDGKSRANVARYINHACAPNAEVEIRQGRIMIFALNNIKSGEELSFDYGTEYFEEFIKPLGCRCEDCLATRMLA